MLHSFVVIDHDGGESKDELNMELIYFHLDMGCRDGIFNNDTVSKQYCSMVAGQFGQDLGRFFSLENFTFLVCPRDPVSRFQFPFVQYHSFIQRFRFCALELLDISGKKFERS